MRGVAPKAQRRNQTSGQSNLEVLLRANNEREKRVLGLLSRKIAAHSCTTHDGATHELNETHEAVGKSIARTACAYALRETTPKKLAEDLSTEKRIGESTGRAQTITRLEEDVLDGPGRPTTNVFHQE